MKVLTIQDISCLGQCSTTIALPILSHYGIETVILPSAILSTHTGGFKDFTFLDLTDEMPKIIDHWIKENIKFDCIYTGYIGNQKQFEYILKCKELLLQKDGLFIVDPAMADNGKLYTGLDISIVNGMKNLCSVADYILPNITEACLLTNTTYQESQDDSFINTLLEKSYKLGAKNVILTGVTNENKIGATAFDGLKKYTNLELKKEKSYHGTGDIFSSIIVADILNKKDINYTLSHACKFIVKCIQKTLGDKNHEYGVKFEEVLKEEIVK